jgi:hypothetical protein
MTDDQRRYWFSTFNIIWWSPDADPCAILTSLRKAFSLLTPYFGRIDSLEVSGTRASILNDATPVLR